MKSEIQVKKKTVATCLLDHSVYFLVILLLLKVIVFFLSPLALYQKQMGKTTENQSKSTWFLSHKIKMKFFLFQLVNHNDLPRCKQKIMNNWRFQFFFSLIYVQRSLWAYQNWSERNATEKIISIKDSSFLWCYGAWQISQFCYCWITLNIWIAIDSKELQWQGSFF